MVASEHSAVHHPGAGCVHDAEPIDADGQTQSLPHVHFDGADSSGHLVHIDISQLQLIYICYDIINYMECLNRMPIIMGCSHQAVQSALSAP